MRKKSKLRLAVLAVIAALCVAAAAVVLSYNHVDHAPLLSKSGVSRYNTAITAVAQGYGYISTEEFVILDTVSKELGGNTEITFRVYRLPDGAQASDYASLRVRDLPADFAPEHMGRGTARLPDDSLTTVIVNVTYLK